MTPVNVVLLQLQLIYNHNIIPNVPLLRLIGHDDIRTLPVVGVGGLTVLYNQSYVARFDTQYTSFTLCSGTNAGSLLVFYNSMLNFELSLTNHALKVDNLFI